MTKNSNYSLSLSLSLRELNCEIFIKKTSFNGYNIVIKSYLSRWMLRGAERVFTPSGARAERVRWSEEVKNREGVASGGATQIGICYHLCFFAL